jgi:hypothetical protein
MEKEPLMMALMMALKEMIKKEPLIKEEPLMMALKELIKKEPLVMALKELIKKETLRMVLTELIKEALMMVLKEVPVLIRLEDLPLMVFKDLLKRVSFRTWQSYLLFSHYFIQFMLLFLPDIVQ